MTTVTRGVRNPNEYEATFDDLRRERSNALVIVGSPVFFTARARLGELALKYHLPTITAQRAYVNAGGLASYGTDYPDLFRGAAEFADKILKGAKPGDLPIEQPTRFELVINLKTAQGTRTHNPTVSAGARRRGDPVIDRRTFIGSIRDKTSATE